MIRLFAAIAVPPDLGEALVKRQFGLPGARWRPLETLHITLRFFGDVREDVAQDLDVELSAIASPPFGVALDGVGAFGEGADIHAVWAGVEASPALSQLARATETAARKAGLKPEARAFRPHVTLAYLRRPDPVAVAAWIEAQGLLRPPPFAVGQFGLYSSHRTHEGSRYQLERVYRL